MADRIQRLAEIRQQIEQDALVGKVGIYEQLYLLKDKKQDWIE
jgi:hypothetical protein